MKLDCYRIHADAPQLVPARPGRAWMDEPGRRFAHRCTPLTMANSTGWELLCPLSIAASWNGGPGPGDLVIKPEDPAGNLQHFAQSKFGHGVLSFDPGYLFRTDPEWAIWCRCAPNTSKDGIAALDGLVETDWLPFTFSMNWQFMRPGTVRFEKDEPFCFILPLPHMEIEAIADNSAAVRKSRTRGRACRLGGRTPGIRQPPQRGRPGERQARGETLLFQWNLTDGGRARAPHSSHRTANG